MTSEWVWDFWIQDGDYLRIGEMVVLPVCIRSGSSLAWITFRAAVLEFIEDEDVNSAWDNANELGDFVELLQRSILSERSGCLVSVGIRPVQRYSWLGKVAGCGPSLKFLLLGVMLRASEVLMLILHPCAHR